MKVFISTIIMLVSTVLLGQTNTSSLNWAYLVGKWECTKATRIFEKKTEDISKKSTPYFCCFFSDLKYSDEQLGQPTNPLVKISTKGKYKIDKPKNLIGYEDLVETINYTDGAYEDYVQKVTKPNLTVIKLTNDFLILNYIVASGDGPGSYTYYFKKI